MLSTLRAGLLANRTESSATPVRFAREALTPARLAIVVFPYEPQLLTRSRRNERAYDTGVMLYRDGIHLSPDGHRRTSAELLRFLDEHRLLPPPRAR